MRTGVRAWASFAAVAAITAGLITGCDAGAKNSNAAIPWCPTVEGYAVDCGSVSRALIEGRPDLGTVDVGYARIKNRGAGPAAGTILPNPGGPGVPMISHAAEAVQVTADLLADHDVLLIDPRGTGVSGAIDCGVGADEFQLGTRAQQRDAVARCADRLGDRAAAYTTAATVDDFDAVRAKLGIDKVIPYGISYGTFLMPVYAQRHPEAIASMVLTGAYASDHDPLQRPNAAAVSLALQRICDRSRACDGATAVEDLRTVAARLREHPLPVAAKQPVVVDEAKLATLVFEAATSSVGAAPQSMTPLGMLPAALHAAVRGDDAGLTEFVRLTTEEPAYENIGLYMTLSCNDYPPLWSREAALPERERQFRQRVAAAAGEFGAFSAEGFVAGQRDGGDVCLRWPGIAGHQRPDQVTTPMPDIPVLVLSGDLDAVTPDANGKQLAAKFARSTFISVPNTGHVPDLEPSGCVSGIVARFVRTGTVQGAECVASVPPIVVAPVTN
ncbi:alpha/beta fold hydrolase [Nocardia sp. ET3-3]|uniref:Alpha/beta fold hydrolase n=1 Tax=Nocardia terrae TaxID=2675851 RepID=A0A7K1VAC8_9NOCA|nr:alpha/beta fold hydrolase [Nocardia terrae]MVU83441.1 alpha/beta fold hydrolase [Nocardia terrae]